MLRVGLRDSKWDMLQARLRRVALPVRVLKNMTSIETREKTLKVHYIENDEILQMRRENYK